MQLVATAGLLGSELIQGVISLMNPVRHSSAPRFIYLNIGYLTSALGDIRHDIVHKGVNEEGNNVVGEVN
jgi:hypothetical protein